MAVKYVELRLKKEWMGHPKGTTLILNEETANSLKSRGTAVFVEYENRDKGANKPEKDKMMRPERVKRIETLTEGLNPSEGD